MAGKRQHFVPQFLQQGFASHFVGEEIFTWVHRKGIKPFNTNVKNSGVEGYFYSVEQNSELDESITDFEGEFNFLISKLLSGTTPAALGAKRIAQLLAHLEARTRHVRESFLETGTHLLDELMKFTSNEEAFGLYFRRAIQRDPSLIQDAMLEEMRRLGIPIRFLPQIIEIGRPLLEQSLQDTLPKMSEFAKQIRISLPGMLKEAAKSGHIEGLMKTLAPESKVNRFIGLQFQVLESPDYSLALGDSIVLFQVEGERTFKPFYEGKDILVAVYLPLSSRKILIGSSAPVKVDFAKLRREIARCSREHFIVSEAPPEHGDISLLIGENAHLLSAYQIENMIHELIND